MKAAVIAAVLLGLGSVAAGAAGAATVLLAALCNLAIVAFGGTL